MSEHPSGITPEEWDDVRTRFKSSMMLKTEIGKLAQNLDMPWPIKGKEEIPLKYIPFTLDELLMIPGIAEKPQRIKDLVTILSETMAFDDPFGDMADYVDSSSKKDDSAQRTLERFGIPMDYPIQLCALSEETKQFCASEEVSTIEAFVAFAQNLAHNIVVGGDFRGFLNALAHPEEATIAKYLPYRIGKNGLHLNIAIGQFISTLKPEVYLSFLTHFGATPTAEDRHHVQILNPAQRQTALKKAAAQLVELNRWFAEDSNRLNKALAEGAAAVDRFFLPIENPNKEKVAAGLARFVLLGEEVVERKSFLGKLFGRN